MDWVREAPVKELEQIGFMTNKSKGQAVEYSATVKGRSIISRDSYRGVAQLQMDCDSQGRDHVSLCKRPSDHQVQEVGGWFPVIM